MLLIRRDIPALVLHFCQDARERVALQAAVILCGLWLRSQVLKSLHQKPARACGRVEDRLAKLGVDHFDDEPHQGTRRVELAGVPGRVAHLLQMDS